MPRANLYTPNVRYEECAVALTHKEEMEQELARLDEGLREPLARREALHYALKSLKGARLYKGAVLIVSNTYGYFGKSIMVWPAGREYENGGSQLLKASAFQAKQSPDWEISCFALIASPGLVKFFPDGVGVENVATMPGWQVGKRRARSRPEALGICMDFIADEIHQRHAMVL